MAEHKRRGSRAGRRGIAGLGLRGVLALLGLGAVAACTAPQQPEPPETTSPRTPLVLDVAEVTIDSEVEELDEGTFIDRRRSRQLLEATRSFLESRFEADGEEGFAEITIEQATLVERPRETEGGIRGAFRREADRELDATIAVSVTILDRLALEEASARAEVGRSRPVLEATSVIARDAIANALISDILEQFDASLTRAVRDNLSEYVIF